MIMSLRQKLWSVLHERSNEFAKGRKEPMPEREWNSYREVRSLLASKYYQKDYGISVHDNPEGVPASLSRCLSDRSRRVRISAAFSICTLVSSDEENKTDFSGAIPDLLRMLSSKKAAERLAASGALAETAEHGTDISPAIRALSGCLVDEDRDVRGKSAEALRNAAKFGADMYGALYPLYAAMQTDDSLIVRVHSTEAIGEAGRRGADVASMVPGLVLCINEQKQKGMVSGVQFEAVQSLRSAAVGGTSISPAFDALSSVLAGGDKYLALIAARAFRAASQNGEDISIALKALFNCLSSDDKDMHVAAGFAVCNALLCPQSSQNAHLLLAGAPGTGYHFWIAPVLDALSERGENGTDISPALPFILACANSGQSHLALAAYRALRVVHKYGVDISPALQSVAKDMESEYGEVCKAAAEAMVPALSDPRAREAALAEMVALLGSGNPAAQAQAIAALEQVSMADIGPAFAALADVFAGGKVDVQHKIAAMLVSAIPSVDYVSLETLAGRLDMLMGSRKFILEAELNTAWYLDVGGMMGTMLKAAGKRILELEEAA
jgi:hypothetical protein